MATSGWIATTGEDAANVDEYADVNFKSYLRLITNRKVQILYSFVLL